MKKGVLRIFAKFTGKQLCQILIFSKVAGLRPATLLKRKLWHRCFPVTFAKFPRTPFYRTPPGDCLYFKNLIWLLFYYFYKFLFLAFKFYFSSEICPLFVLKLEL